MSLRILLFTFLILLSCQKNSKISYDDCTSYNLKQPTTTWEMPKKLREISGIAVINTQKLICVNDEKAHIYLYDLTNSKIEKSNSFAKNGDYEDIAFKDSTAFVLRSDGTIFEVKNYMDAPKTIKHKTFLSKTDDTEGMFYDATNNRLIIACKGNSEVKPGMYTRLVYEFLLEDKRLNSKPVFTISGEKLHSKYNFKKHFSPSGIAIHPITNNIYILSSVGKVLVEYTSKGKLKKLFNLNYSHFQQPEGISFDKNGDLYISNEGKKKNGNILKFNHLQ